MSIDFEEEFKDLLINFGDCSDDSTDDNAKVSIPLRPRLVDIVSVSYTHLTLPTMAVV